MWKFSELAFSYACPGQAGGELPCQRDASNAVSVSYCCICILVFCSASHSQVCVSELLLLMFFRRHCDLFRSDASRQAYVLRQRSANMFLQCFVLLAIHREFHMMCPEVYMVCRRMQVEGAHSER